MRLRNLLIQLDSYWVTEFCLPLFDCVLVFMSWFECMFMILMKLMLIALLRVAKSDFTFSIFSTIGLLGSDLDHPDF